MESSSYFKTACTHCGGNIEAPSEGAGMWVHCPHCGEKTQLVAPPPRLDGPAPQSPAPTKRSGTRWILIIGLICLVCGALVIAGAAFFLRSAKTVSPATTSSPVATPATPAQPTIPKVEPAPDLWNGLKPGAVAIQKPDKGRLIYAVGSIRNDSDKQRYGVKVTLDVLDANGEKIGSAVDQTQFIDAHKEWNYKALVTSSKAKSAKVAAITED